MLLTVPPTDDLTVPSLGPAVWAWIRKNLVYGPGDRLGEPIDEDEEWAWALWRAYQVHPRGHPNAGRRIFRRVVISRPKGRAKTELAAFIAAAELHPRAPVRTVGWGKNGHPKGGPIRDPYIPLVAYTEDQAGDTVYGALRKLLEKSPVAGDFDIGLDRITRRDGTGKAQALPAAPDQRDGARTTFQAFEETHRWTTPKLKEAYRVMRMQIPKRRAADAWSLEVTTAFAPGQGSIGEASHAHAVAVAEGRVKDSTLFFTHRQALPEADLSTPEAVRAAVLEATGEVAAPWRDVDTIVASFFDPSLDQNELRRFYLNQVDVRTTGRAFDAAKWATLVKPHEVPAGALITIGFDGARTDDAAALVGTEVATRYQFLLGLWEKPTGPEGERWRVPEDEVNLAVDEAFHRWTVWRLYADPPYWREAVAGWIAKYGTDRVLEWFTNRPRAMALAVKGFADAITNGDLSHSGDAGLGRHVANAYRREVGTRDEEGARMWSICKGVKTLKIDAAMAAILSWESARDAVAAGALQVEPEIEEEYTVTRLL